VNEYDDLIEQAAAQLAGCIISPTPEREAALGRFIGEAQRLRSSRLDDWVSRDEAIALWWDVVETLRRALEAELVEFLPGKPGPRRGSDRARARCWAGNDVAGAHRSNG